MDKNTIIIILALVVLAFLFMSFTKAKRVVFIGNLVSAGPEAGYTNAYYNINQATTQQSYWLTFTPEGFTKEIPNNGNLPQSKEISSGAYKAFITKYPSGKAQGNVLDKYN